MFLCREKELAELNYRYQNGSFECIIIYGRRRVGKTALINEFCKGKKVVYFPALKGTAQDNLEAFSIAIETYRNPDTPASVTYASFQDAFRFVGTLAREERLVLVIDEYPYLAKCDGTISSRLQHLIDLEWKQGRMFLILCGSSVSFMEDAVLAYDSPLYGRRTGQMHLQPLDYHDSGVFNDSLDPLTKAEMYGITGGIPFYIEKLNVRGNLDEALKRNFFNPSCYLFEEPENLLKQELREPSVYNAIIKVVAEGATKLHEIGSKAGIETASCTAYIKTLVELGIMEKETPFGTKEGTRSIYRIKDPFFRFWYRFVPRNIGAIMTGRIDKTYEFAVKQYLHDYMGQIFETMCGQYLMQYDGTEEPLNNVGRWWGSDRIHKKEVEIDLVGELAGPKSSVEKYVTASCKFRNRPFSMKDLEELREYSKLFNAKAEFRYYAFSISGFSDEVLKEADTKHNVRLVTLEDMYR